MANVKFRGMDFVVVNEVSEKLLSLINKALECWEEDFDEYEHDLMYPTMKKHFKYLGGGYCGRVFELDEDTVIKVESGSYSGCMDGMILERLQGLPFVPKVYMYTDDEDNSITIMQKIKGVTITEYLKGKAPFSLLKAPKNLTVAAENFIIQAGLERGVEISDVKSDNCMIDEQGNFYMIDYGVCDFIDPDRYKRYYNNQDKWSNNMQIEKMHALTTFIENVAGSKLGREHYKFASMHSRAFGGSYYDYYYYYGNSVRTPFSPLAYYDQKKYYMPRFEVKFGDLVIG
ncbi:serine/threonine kinase [Bacillus phage 019DV002]|uniref:Serine/threonine kinase n=1 Tax=Bacillus phage 019DV002 TaxID=2601653 RepID=A0A5J6T428_9CAUD|nr:serine/threonine kinase [Bacillus phage 019DV002]QFG05289.1 serine/threonine kinase [Bacillus phage 019DV004]